MWSQTTGLGYAAGTVVAKTQISAPNTAPPGGGVAAVARTPWNLDVFFVNVYGVVMDMSSSNGGTSWGGTGLPELEPAPPGAQITAASPTTESLDVFYVGNGGLYQSSWTPIPGWSTVPVPGTTGLAPAGASVSAVSRIYTHLDVAFVGNNGALYEASSTDSTSAWTDGGAWTVTEISGSAGAVGPISLVARKAYNLDVFFVGSNGSPETTGWNVSTNTWTAVSPIPLQLPSSPSVFQRPSNEIDVVTQGPDNSLVYQWTTEALVWNSAQIAGPGTTFSAPSLFVRPSGEADVVAQGPNNALEYYYAFPGTGWSHTEIAEAGTTFSGPSVSVAPNGLAFVVAVGPNNTLMWYTAAPGSAWGLFPPTELPPEASSIASVSLFVRPTEEVDIVAQRTDDSLWYFCGYSAQCAANALPGVQLSESQLGSPGTAFSAPSIYVRSTGEVDVVAEGANNSLTYFDWTPFVSNGVSTQIAGAGTTFSAPTIFVQENSSLGAIAAYVAVQGANHTVEMYSAVPGGPWSGEELLEGGSRWPSRRSRRHQISSGTTSHRRPRSS